MFHSRQRSLKVAAMLALAFIFSGAIPLAHAAADRCFPGTNQCIGGRFRQYWEQNGGLQVFGFPIAPAREERNRDTGQSYLTQWFERNRFELHPENAAPYDVLLGRLGDDRLLQTGRDWRQEAREPGPQAGCLWFEQTGRNVCNQGGALGFRQYWETHGLQDPRLNAYQRSLALFGLPLTTPRAETNSSGDTVVTQWFERARFEWHPDKPAEFKVLLGRLGDEALRGGPGGERPSGRIVYVSRPNGATAGDLHIMNADGTGQRRLTAINAIRFDCAEIAVSPAGDRIAYRAGVGLYVISTEGGVPQLFAAAPAERMEDADLFAPTWSPDGSYLAYTLQGDIYARRDIFTSPVRITQTGDVSSPACLSWARNGYLTFRAAARNTFKLFVVRSDGSDLRQIAWGLCGTLSPAGDRMVYTNGAELWLVNLDGSNARALATGRNYLPGIWSPNGAQILTVGYSSDNAEDREIFVVDPDSGRVQQLTTGASVDYPPAWSPDGKFVTFASRRTGRSGIYVVRADGSNLIQLATPEESAAPRWVAR